MQPKWVTTREPNKSESALIADIKRRHGKNVNVRIGTSEIYHRRKIPSPSQQATKIVETNLARCIGLELPVWADEILTITLNKLDKLPSLRKCTELEREARKQLPMLVDTLIADVAALKKAYAADDAKKAAWAWGFACNIVGKLEALWDLPEIAEGLESPKRRKHGGERTQAKFAKRRAELSAKYQPDIDRRVLHEGQSYDLALTYTANQHGIPKDTLRKYVHNPRRRQKPVA